MVEMLAKICHRRGAGGVIEKDPDYHFVITQFLGQRDSVISVVLIPCKIYFFVSTCFSR